ncbi:MAG: flagellar hook-length control protein FliK [Thermodesulfobacteriota bacterium]
MMDMSPLNLLRGGEVKEHTKSPATDKREGERDVDPVFTIDESLFNPAAALGQPLPSEIMGQNMEGGEELSTPVEFSVSGEEETSITVPASIVETEEGEVDTVGESERAGNVKVEESGVFKSLQPEVEMAEGDDLLDEKGLDEVTDEEGVNKLAQEGGKDNALFKEVGKVGGGDQKLSAVTSQLSSNSLRERRGEEKGEGDEEHTSSEAIDDSGGEGGGGERSAPLSSAAQHGASDDKGGKNSFSRPLEVAPDVESLTQGKDFEVTSGDERGVAKEVSTVTSKGGAVTTSQTLGRMVIEQVGSKIGLFFRDGIGKASIRLDPPSLGRLQIEIVMKDSMARAHIVAEHESVKELIEQNLATLKDALAKEGISVNDLTVSLDSRGSESSDGMRWGEQGETEGWGGTDSNHHAGARIPSITGLVKPDNATGVDIYV